MRVRRLMLGVVCVVAVAGATVWAQAATTDLGLNLFQAQTAWVSPHRDMQNTDFVPFASVSRYQVKWRAEDTNTTIWAPSIGPDGNLYVATGRAGDPNLHAYGIDGTLVWESGVPLAGSDPNPVSAGQLPFIDIDGDIYISDNAFFWAFHADGTLKWKTALPPVGTDAQAFIGGPVLTSAGLIGGVTNRGEVRFYDRTDGVQVVPTFDLPGGAAPSGDPTPAGLWGGGELAPAFVDVFWAGFNGFGLEVSNTPAMHPDIDRLYITATSSTTSMEGALYALDLVGGQWQIGFESPLGANSGTSPALSPDATQVYAVGGDNALAAYDAVSGALLWTAAGVTPLASPQVGPDGTVYSGSVNGVEIFAINPDGSEKWRRNYDNLARQMLPVLGTASLLTTGQPVARADSVTTITGSNVKVILKLGYDFQPPGGAVNTAPNIVVLASICPIDGQILDYVVLPDDGRGTISMSADGHVFTSHAAAFTSILFYAANPFIAESARITTAPAAGITALAPVSFLEQATAGLVWARSLADFALAGLAEAMVSPALTASRRAMVQLGATASSFFDAEAAGELGNADATARSVTTTQAQVHLAAAVNALETVPVTQAELDVATGELQAALVRITAAEEALTCNDGVVCTSGDTFTSGVCRGGMATSVSALKLNVTLKDAATSSARDKVVAKVVFPLAELTGDPDVTGLTFEIANDDGKTFFSGTLPPARFVDRRGKKQKFSFKDKNGSVAGANDIRKASVKKIGKKGEVVVSIKARGAETHGADGHTVLSTSLLFGTDPLVDACPAAAFAVCQAKLGKRVRCRLP